MNSFKSKRFGALPAVFFTVFIVVSLFLSIGCGKVSSKPGTQKSTAVDLAALEKFIETHRQTFKVPGMAVAVVKDGKVVLSRGFGVKEYGKTGKVDENTLFAIASNSKAFAAASLAILVDRGKIKWDDKVVKYLPYFQLYDPYVTREMTIRDLLRHNCGLRTFSGDLLWYETQYDAPEIIKRARHLKPKFSFRAGYGYSNIMYTAAGEIVPAVTGKSWGDFVKENLFKPLDMKTTNIGIAELKKQKNYATPHFIDLDGNTVKVPYSTSDRIAAAAGINSNVKEMTNWITMLLGKGNYKNQQLLSYDRLYEMWSPQNIIPISQASVKFFPAVHFKAYGLGWGLSDYHGCKIISHGGALDGMISRVTLVPEKQLGFVILSNSINSFPGILQYKILDTYLGIEGNDRVNTYKPLLDNRDIKRKMKRDAFMAEIATPRESLDETGLKSYTGTYNCPLYGSAKVALENGKLVLHFVPAPVLISDLFHKENDTFIVKLRNRFSFIPIGMGTVWFTRDSGGSVTGMKVDIPNNDFHFTELDFKK